MYTNLFIMDTTDSRIRATNFDIELDLPAYPLAETQNLKYKITWQ